MKLGLEKPPGFLPWADFASHCVAIAPQSDSSNARDAAQGGHRRRSFGERIVGRTIRHVAMWEAADSKTPRFGPNFGPDEQARREQQADRCLADINRRLRQYPGRRAQREVWREDFLRALRTMAGECLGFPEAGLRLFFNRTAMEATRRFIREAKAFDPAMSDASVFQALRNLWVIHNLQLFLGSDLGLSPAGFGYSMLYPWTDNFLDDPRIPERSKAAFGDWLGRRLEGDGVPAPDPYAAQVSRLVALIEECFSRPTYPEVFLSLRAIHDAQMASLRQQRTGGVMSEQEILAITVEKGGTSVLADGYLVRGRLNEAEADFVFGYGVLLQLMDDLRDLRNDLANRHTTLFTWHAARGPLDAITSRLWAFTQTVLRSSRRFASPRFNPLSTLIRENCRLMLLQSVAQNRDFYRERFARALEAGSPFRLDYLQKRGESFRCDCAKLAAFMRRKHGINSIMDALD